MAKRLPDLSNTARFLVDTMRPRRVHGTVEGFRGRRSALDVVLFLLVLGAFLAGAYYGLVLRS